MTLPSRRGRSRQAATPEQLPAGRPPARRDGAGAGSDSGAGTAGAGPAGGLEVHDRVDRRIRVPVDLLRFVVGCLGLALLVGLGLVARQTAAGLETDVLGAGRRLPDAILAALSIASAVALVILGIGLAIDQFFRRQLLVLGEAVLTGGLTIGLVAGADILLRSSFASQLHSALTNVPAGGVTSPLDAYLAGTLAYVSVLGVSERSWWPTVVSVVVGIDALAILTARQTTVLGLALTLVLGRTIGVGVRYAVGLPTVRPQAADIAKAVGAAVSPVAVMWRVWQPGLDTRRYSARLRDGSTLDISVFDRDREAAGFLYRLYRQVRLRSQVARDAVLSVERSLERHALLSLAFVDAGVCTPRLRAAVPVAPDTAVLANDHIDGTTLAAADGDLSDDQLRSVWRTVRHLHAHHLTHRNLTADRIVLAADGEVVLLEPGTGDLAATDLQVRLDMAQLLAEMGLLVGADRAASVALEEVGAAELADVAPLLQRIALARPTRAALRGRKGLLNDLRQRIEEAAEPGVEVAPVQLERVRPRTIVTIIAGAVAGYLLVGNLTEINFGHLIRSTDWRWALLAAALSAATYVAAAAELLGFVTERLSYLRTALAQLAGSFVTLVTPAAVGGIALNVRYLQRAAVSPAAAAASVGVSQVVAFAMHILLVVIAVGVSRTGHGLHINPPTWVYSVIGGLVVLVAVAVALPPGRRLLRARLVPTVNQVVPRLLDVAQQPRKMIEGFGGALVVSAAYILCLDASIRAIGGHVGIANVAVVYLAGSALGSAVPTPGGLGGVEAALSAGLTAAGLGGGESVSAVLLFRLLTFWIPVPLGWLAFHHLQQRDAL